MKPSDEIKREFLNRWMLKAEEDLDLARHLLDTQRTFLNAIGFHAQQAAEKYLKAYMTAVEIDFPKTHSIEHLLKLAASPNPELSAALREAIVLSDYGVEARYPGDLPELSAEQALTAVTLAQKVRDEIAGALKSLDF